MTTTGDTVTIANKLPHGLVLQLQEEGEIAEETAFGTIRMRKQFSKVGDTIEIKGCAVPVGAPNDKQIIGGFALTHGVDADFWAKWISQNQRFPPFQKGLIFAYEKASSTEGEAKEKADIKSGFEPVDPDNLPPEFRAVERAKFD